MALVTRLERENVWLHKHKERQFHFPLSGLHCLHSNQQKEISPAEVFSLQKGKKNTILKLIMISNERTHIFSLFSKSAEWCLQKTGGDSGPDPLHNSVYVACSSEFNWTKSVCLQMYNKFLLIKVLSFHPFSTVWILKVLGKRWHSLSHRFVVREASWLNQLDGQVKTWYNKVSGK